MERDTTLDQNSPQSREALSGGETPTGAPFDDSLCPEKQHQGTSLVEMAQRDLSATLQLLAERAQYITGASGAAIALREGEKMLCRASAGPSAPELGTRLQIDSGLSGESVRTKQILRCDDAENDARVNRESCRALGIASVMVMPLIRENEVNGVFELFSGRPYAFEERDVIALQRIAELIQTAVEHADAAKRAEKEIAGETIVAEEVEPADVSPPAESIELAPRAEAQTEVPITDRREKELADQGFIPLVHCKGTDYAAFFSVQSAQKAKLYDKEAANANARLSTQLPYIFAVSRFAHYLKAMMRDKLGSFMSRTDCERWLNQWISGFVENSPTATEEMKARFPLSAAKVVVENGDVDIVQLGFSLFH